MSQGDPNESAERGILCRLGGRRFSEDFLKEVIAELILKKGYKLIR